MKIKLFALALTAGMILAATVSTTRAQNPVIAGTICDSCDKVCRPTTEMKKVTKRVYSCGKEDFCLPKATFLGHGDCTECSRVHTKKYLIVKLRTSEECVTKCVPVPACDAGTVIIAPAVPAAPAAPAAKMPTRP